MDQSRAHTVQPDYSGLQAIGVINAADAPEALPPASQEKEHVGYTPYHKADNGVYAVPEGGYTGHTSAPVELPASVPPWWRRKRWIFTIVAVGIVAVVAIVVGVVVGGRKGDGSSSSPNSGAGGAGGTNDPGSNNPGSNTTDGLRSACRDTVCPQILAAASLQTTSSSPDLLLFARGVDNDIWYTYATASQLNPAWPSDREWQSLGGGPFVSQPSANTWRRGGTGAPQASFYAVSDADHSVLTKRFTDPSVIPSTWENMASPAATALTTCTVNGTRPDFWTIEGRNTFHKFRISNETTSVETFSDFSQDYDFGIEIASRPAVACRPSQFFHDMVVIGSDGALRHSTYSLETWWRTQNQGGKFVGDPVVVSTSADRVDVSAIGSRDRAMYHYARTTSGGFRNLESAGGQFQSVPSVVVTGGGSRIDVVALGTNDRLQHRVLKGFEWATPEWEDLGVFGNSAPLLWNLTSARPEKVGVFVVGVGGEVNQTTWTVSDDELSWKGLTWTNIGGKMTTAFYRPVLNLDS